MRLWPAPSVVPTSELGSLHAGHTGISIGVYHGMRNDPLEISLRLSSINELLRAPGIRNRKRSISPEAEEFIIEEAESLPPKGVIIINVYLASTENQYEGEIPPAIHSHFCYRKVQAKRELKVIFQRGWRMMGLALLLLAVIFTFTEIASWLAAENKVVTFIRESFIILGWVALWRPMESLLYDWYPVKRNMVLFGRLEESNVRVIIEESSVTR